MKRFIILLFILIQSSLNSFSYNLESDYLNANAQIDSTDTVFFHFDKTVVNGSVTYVPLSYSSDDTIYSVDFSFRYNVDSVTCDSIQDLANYIELSDYFYNTNDSTMRYTSFSLQPYTSDTMLANIYFNLGSSTDSSKIGMFDVKGYLNGNQCAARVILPIITGISEDKSSILPLAVYPNPTAGLFKVESIPGAKVYIYDAKGNIILSDEVAKNGIVELNLNHNNVGLYLIKVLHENNFTSYRILKN